MTARHSPNVRNNPRAVKLPVPVGNIEHLEIVSNLCLKRIQNYGQHFVLVDPQGDVYAVKVDVRAYALVERTPQWMAGVFQCVDKLGGKIVAKLKASDLAEAIQATYGALA